MRQRMVRIVAVAGAAVLMAATGLTLSPVHPEARADEHRDPIVDDLSPDHPRLLATDADFAALRSRVATDATLTEWHGRLQQAGDRILTEPPSEYDPGAANILQTSRQVLTRVETLAMLYQLSDDAQVAEEYAERAWVELAAAADFPDWNPSHFLDTAEMTRAFAIGYDWLYHYWTSQRRDVLRDAIVTMGLTPALAVYRGETEDFNWAQSPQNWNIVSNGGIGMGALAIGDEVPALAEEILQSALDSLPIAIAEYAPDGGYAEGLGSYWGYATRYLVPFISSLRTAVGDDFGLSASDGLPTTGDFPIYLTGPTGLNFNYYDAQSGSPQPPEMLWLATEYDQPVYTWWGEQGAAAAVGPHHLLWYEPGHASDPVEADLPLDAYFRHSEVATFRSAWEDPRAVFTGFKAGDNQTNHGDLDLGSFILDALGTRWAAELGVDSYGLPGYFGNHPEGLRWTYYRKRAEGQNTLVVNPEAGIPGSTADQDSLATGEIVGQESGPTEAFAVAELTEAYAAHGVTSWQRGVRLLDHRRQVLVQDELTAAGPVDAWWFMHTRADIEISPDGKTATLRRFGQRLEARILAPGDGAEFVTTDAGPLWTSPDPDGQADNPAVQRLAIEFDDVSDLQLSVLFTPLREWQQADGPPAVEPLTAWSIADPEVNQLSEIQIDGQPLPDFDPDKLTYDVVAAPGSTPPTVTATAAGAGSTVVDQASAVPGTAEIEVLGPDAPVTYEVHFGPAGVAGQVIASADAGHGPENTLDGDLGTRWSAEGDGQWIRYDLGEPTAVDGVSIAWYQGDARSASFDIETSTDGQAWTQVHSGSSSGATTELEQYTFPETTARYVRIVGHGNTANTWNSITEVRVHHAGGTWPSIVIPPPHLEKVAVSADPDELSVGETAQLDVTGQLSDGTPADLTGATITYVVDDDQIAQVSPSGVVEGLNPGTVEVTAIVATADHELRHGSLTLTVDDPYTVTLEPSGDAYVQDGAAADDNFGTAGTMLVKRAQQSGFNRETYLSFDLSEVGGTVVEATVHFSAEVQDGGGDEIDVVLHEIGDVWQEDTVTWNTKPALGEPVATTHVDDNLAWRSADVTSFAVQQIAGDGQLSLAVAQAPPSGNGLNTLIRSRESQRQPYLKIKLAQEETLVPVADTYVTDGAPNDNFGSDILTLVKKSQQPGFNRESYLSFDLSEVEGTVVEATLSFSAQVQDGAGSEIDVVLHEVGDGWQEDVVTWNSRPTLGDPMASVHVGDDWAWRSADVTSYVAEEAAGDGHVSFGVTQDPPSGNGLNTLIRSRESQLQPYLELKVARGETLTPVADSYVNDGSAADDNFGSQNTMLVKKAQQPGFNRESYLAFDVSGIQGDVSEATLHFSARVQDGAGDEVDLVFHAIGDGWEEDTVTWNTRPALADPVGTVHVDDAFAWRSVDVTSYVAHEVAGDGRLSLGVTQDPPTGDGLNTAIRSRENGIYPYLEITLAREETGAPVADAYVQDGGAAGDNFGSENTMLVKKTSQVGTSREAYLAFDVSGLEGDLVQATLLFSAQVQDGAGSEIDLVFHEIGDGWDESTVTWNTRPALGGTVATAHVGEDWAWRSVDVTSYAVQEAAGDGQLSLGITQDPPSGDGLNTLIRSRENGIKPYLILTYAPD